MRIGHISDVHAADRGRYPHAGLTPKDADKFSMKFAQGRLKALREANLDHLFVTGDLTLSGEASEYKRGLELFKWWIDEGKVTFLPGNHDVWTIDAMETFRFWRSVGPDGKGMKKAVNVYPYVTKVGEYDVVALDTARYGDDPFATHGQIGADQLQKTRELVKSAAAEGRHAILALHHHVVLPAEHVASDVHTAKMPLADADQLVRLVAELPVAAVLHGHRHAAFRVDLPGLNGPVPVLCAGCGSRVIDEPARRARAFAYEFDRGSLVKVEAFVQPYE